MVSTSFSHLNRITRHVDGGRSGRLLLWVNEEGFLNFPGFDKSLPVEPTPFSDISLVKIEAWVSTWRQIDDIKMYFW